jgi:hypothetical protein
MIATVSPQRLKMRFVRAHTMMIGIGDPVFAELANERRYQQLINRLRLPAVQEAS